MSVGTDDPGTPPPDKPRRKAPAQARAAKAHEVTASQAFRDFHAKYGRPRPTDDDVCALIACFFPKARHYCGAGLRCPPECPRVGGQPAPPPPAAPPPPLTPEERAAQERGLSVLRAKLAAYTSPEHAVRLEIAVDEAAAEPDPVQEAIWNEAVESWFAADSGPPVSAAPAPAPPVPAAPASSDPPGWRHGMPPCIGCGQHKAIMVVFAPPRPGEKGFRMCSACCR